MTDAQVLERLAPVTALVQSLPNGDEVRARLSSASTYAEGQEAMEAGMLETLHAAVAFSKVVLEEGGAVEQRRAEEQTWWYTLFKGWWMPHKLSDHYRSKAVNLVMDAAEYLIDRWQKAQPTPAEFFNAKELQGASAFPPGVFEHLLYLWREHRKLVTDRPASAGKARLMLYLMRYSHNEQEQAAAA